MAANSSSELTFVDEDDLPVAFLRIAHEDSENEAPLNVNSSDSENSSDESEDESDDSEGNSDEVYSNLRWSSRIQAPPDVDFNEEVGIKVDMPENSTCLDFFELFFTHDVYKIILDETIRFERQKRQLEDSVAGNLQNCSVEELKAWLGLTLAMDLVKKINLKSYWSTNSVIKTPLFTETMSRDRYLTILRYLHFVNNDNAPAPDDVNRDKLWKIRPFLASLLPRFTAVYAPSQNLSLDETLIKFKGRVQFRQFLPLKRNRFGLKGFVIADSSNGYVLNTIIYTGKEGPAASKDLASRVVLQLIEPYTNSGYRLYVDNWYTSVPLFLELERRGILACGTVRPNRKYLPKDIVDAKQQQVKNLARGESLFKQTGNLVCVTWKDKKNVHLLSTLPEGTDMGQVERKVKSQGRWEKKNFPQPKLIQMYNAHMGGVDLGDQRMATCSRLMKGSVWYYKIFFHMFEVAVLNAHIMYQNAGHQSITLGQFKEKLVQQLIGGHCFRQDDLELARSGILEDTRLSRTQFHYPVETETRRDCKVHIQRVGTSYQCGICHVKMCPYPCFQRYHTLRDYLFDDPSRDGPKRLKDGNGRPRAGPGRPRQRRSR